MKFMLGKCLQMSLASGGGIGKGCGPGAPWHTETSLPSAFPVLLRRWTASPGIALFPGVEFGSGIHLQSVWHESWGEAAGPFSAGLGADPSLNWQLLSPPQSSSPVCPRSVLNAPPGARLLPIIQDAEECPLQCLGRFPAPSRLCRASPGDPPAEQGPCPLPSTAPSQHPGSTSTPSCSCCC